MNINQSSSPPPEYDPESVTTATPLFKFGVVADFHYADCEDGSDFFKLNSRHYKMGISRLKESLDVFHQQGVNFVVNFGDLIDGNSKNSNQPKDQNNTLPHTLSIFNQYKSFPSYHIIGNHELYCYSRHELSKIFSNPLSSSTSYQPFYSFRPMKYWKCIVLDCFDYSCMESSDPTITSDSVYDFLSQSNPNDLRSNNDWFIGVKGRNRRFVPYNGGILPQQQTWLHNELVESLSKHEKVIIFSHIGWYPDVVSDSDLLFNYDEIISLTAQYRNIVLVLNGHSHIYGYSYNPQTKTHYRSLESPIKLKADSNAFGIVNIYEEMISIKGYGQMKSQILNI